ncbi:hypothetical protein DJ77_08525 [Halorubrum ezzemoulense]|nr:hypothetical protein DJ77_08525 [Halorubrum ezzemoulense]
MDKPGDRSKTGMVERLLESWREGRLDAATGNDHRAESVARDDHLRDLVPVHRAEDHAAVASRPEDQIPVSTTAGGDPRTAGDDEGGKDARRWSGKDPSLREANLRALPTCLF